jgi:hypothetical protein
LFIELSFYGPACERVSCDRLKTLPLIGSLPAPAPSHIPREIRGDFDGTQLLDADLLERLNLPEFQADSYAQAIAETPANHVTAPQISS